MHVPAVPNLPTRHVQTYKLHGFVFRPHPPTRHVFISTRSYTDFPGLVEIAAERKRGASLHGKEYALKLTASYHDGDYALDGGYT
jgi:hypothetical protein